MYITKTKYVCPHCKTEYDTIREAVSCESKHRTCVNEIYIGNDFSPIVYNINHTINGNRVTEENYPKTIEVKFKDSDYKLKYELITKTY